MTDKIMHVVYHGRTKKVFGIYYDESQAIAFKNSNKNYKKTEQ